MDTAVSLVQSYLYMNGFFTVTEYPVLELMEGGEYRTVTDVDLLAVRLPGPGRVDAGHPGAGLVSRLDPSLGVDPDGIDMIIAEVKEGRAELNKAALDPAVLHAVLHRFGSVPEPEAEGIVAGLLANGVAHHPAGPRIRLFAFGSRPPRSRSVTYNWLTMGHIGGFLHRVISENWSAAQTIQSKDPALGFLLLLEKAVRGEADRRS